MKEKSLLFERILVLTPDDGEGMRVLPDHHVAVRGPLVAYVGPSREEARRCVEDTDLSVVDGRDACLLPSFANAHTHTAMTLLRNAADDKALHEWLFEDIFPREARLRPRDIQAGTRLGLCEMIRSGTTASADMYFLPDLTAEAVLESGFRMLLSVDAKEQDPGTGRRRLRPEDLERFLSQFEGAGDGRIRTALLVHSIYLYEPEIYPAMAEAARSLGTRIHVHVSETEREVRDCIDTYGARPPEILERFGLLDGPTLAAHCVHLDDADRAILSRHGVTAVHNPSSNLKLGSGFADVPAMQAAGIRVALGTDGAASNNTLDLYREVRLASFLAKGLYRDATRLPAARVLRMATCDGFEGIGFPRCGRVAPGCEADLQVVRFDHPSMQPEGDPVSALVYSADGGRVDTVVCQGRPLLWKGALTTLDEERIVAEARSSAAHLRG